MATKKAVKSMKKPAKKVGKKPARRIVRMSAKKSSKPKYPWFDGSAKPLIGEYAQRTQSFIDTIADGKVTDAELKAQENRLIGAMKSVEPLLGTGLHDKVTHLLCELAAYDFMQALHGMNQARGESVFRG
jgi:hypothetical protein